MSRPRQHHFVPEFYLEGFTRSGTRNDRINVLDLNTGSSWNQVPKEIATRRDFYAADIPGLDSDEMEKGLSRLEDLSAPVIRRIRETRTLPTDDQELDHLLNFVATTAIRVPKFRAILAQPFVQFAKKTMRDIVESPEAFKAHQESMQKEGRSLSSTYEGMKAFVESGDYMIDVDPPTHLQNLLLGTEEVLKWLSRQCWSLVIADDSAPDFIGSDCPVVFIQNARHWEEWALAPEKMPTEVVMPISRRLVLWGLASSRCILPPVTADVSMVASFNTFILAQAERYVFTSDGRITWGETEGKLGTAESLIATLLDD